ncbi:unnamed protein product [Ceutorhynchus assimilis]|uniref:Uncharacterized protein n=1 Tax=Ceutorhynchus assimilis TaxID=467358 RepID=A0A9N9QFP3_9CUCU|nr:unnamed protein product [Ceutorhynchus assimilis]
MSEQQPVTCLPPPLPPKTKPRRAAIDEDRRYADNQDGIIISASYSSPSSRSSAITTVNLNTVDLNIPDGFQELTYSCKNSGKSHVVKILINPEEYPLDRNDPGCNNSDSVVSSDVVPSGETCIRISVNNNHNTMVDAVGSPQHYYFNQFNNLMSSGQMSPSDTLDSGTCSDLDGTPPPLTKKKNGSGVSVTLIGSHKKTASLSDSDDNESNISCDSLNCGKVSPIAGKPTIIGARSKSLILPQNLLKDIRQRKVTIKDVSGCSYNKTINECAERTIFEQIKVKELYFKQQNLSTLGKDSVKNLIHLKTLVFWGNSIDNILPGAFRNLPNLKNLQLSHDNLKEIPKNIFNKLASLESLKLHNNQINIIETQAFANLTSLKRLIINNNNLEYWNKDWFTNTSSLFEMNFQNNKIRTIPKKAFANLPNLKKILLDFNEITLIQADAFKGLTNLDYLGLKRNRLVEIDDNIFPNSLNIKSLSLDANYLNFLTDKLLKKLYVEDISLDNNPWKCPCLDKIKSWIRLGNGTLSSSKSCASGNVPVCAFAQTCSEQVDNGLTEAYLRALKKLKLPKFCARLN